MKTHIFTIVLFLVATSCITVRSSNELSDQSLSDDDSGSSEDRSTELPMNFDANAPLNITVQDNEVVGSKNVNNITVVGDNVTSNDSVDEKLSIIQSETAATAANNSNNNNNNNDYNNDNGIEDGQDVNIDGNTPYPGTINGSQYENKLRFWDDNPNPVEITSPDYPKPYPDNVNLYWIVTVEGGTGIDVTVHIADMDPTTDFLYFRGGKENDTDETGPTITGNFTDPMHFKILHTIELYVWFHSNVNSNQHKGFRMSYSPFGKTTDPLTTEPNELITMPANKIEYYEIILKVEREKQTPLNWDKFRYLLCESTNEFVKFYELELEECQPENVTFSYIRRCPDTWPGFETCIRVEFAIPLWHSKMFTLTSLQYNDDIIGTTNEGIIDLDPNSESEEVTQSIFELTTGNLERMWIEFGKINFAENSYHEYQIPDARSIILIWLAISLSIVIVFLIVLYTIWKVDFFQDYRRMTSTPPEDKMNIFHKNSMVDLSMIPTPYQNVPEFFPTNEEYIRNGIPYDFESRSITFTQNDLNNANGKNGHGPMQLEDEDEVIIPPRRKSVVAFSPIVDYNDQKPQGNPQQNIFFPDDEFSFSISSTQSSPLSRAKITLRRTSAVEDESLS